MILPSLAEIEAEAARWQRQRDLQHRRYLQRRWKLYRGKLGGVSKACPETNGRGLPCRRWAMYDSRYCYNHRNAHRG